MVLINSRERIQCPKADGYHCAQKPVCSLLFEGQNFGICSPQRIFFFKFPRTPVFLFFSFLASPPYLEFPGLGSDPSCSCDLHGKARSLAHCTRPALQRCHWFSATAGTPKMLLKDKNVSSGLLIQVLKTRNHANLDYYIQGQNKWVFPKMVLSVIPCCFRLFIHYTF